MSGGDRGSPPATDGETASFEEEALPHRVAIKVLALQLTRDTDEAEDLVQDTYYKALRYWHTYRRDTNCRAWLARVCRNEFVRGLHRDRTRPERAKTCLEEDILARGDSASFLAMSAPDPLEHLSQRRLLAAVEDSLAAVPSPYRAPLGLCLDGIPYRDIAATLGLPDGTVKSRIHRGRQLLRKALEGFC